MAANDDKRGHTHSLTGSVLGFPAHQDRSRAIGEVHSRPSPMFKSPRFLIQLAFMTEAGSGVDHSALANLSRQQGATVPDRAARHHSMKWGQGKLFWERHTEFSTYLWETPANGTSGNGTGQGFAGPFGEGFSPPGVVISGVRMEVVPWTKAAERKVADFDRASLCFSIVENGQAAVVTDFRQDGDGLTRMRVLDKGLPPARAGALAKHLIEIENYRVLALLGLPLAQSLSSQMRIMEDRLAELTNRMRSAGDRDSHNLLAELTELAAELEADSAASQYRFGASRAYDGIIAERLEALGEEPVAGYESLSAFLQRRVAPAMRTCRSIEERQANLSRKIARATTLLRTWVDVDQEQQNRALLASMNRRAKLQLRLQHTVEGLSIAAVSYYVVSLISYVIKGTSLYGANQKTELLTALSVPVVVLCLWLFVRRLRGAAARDAGQSD